MNKLKQWKYNKPAGAVISLLCGLVFVYSAYTKLHPIELFELTFVDIGLGNWTIAPLEARLLIGLEFFLGFLLLLNLNPKGLTYKLALALLAIFTIYLIFQIAVNGNRGNCGCFGTALKMTPLEGIIKNVVLMAILLFLLFFFEGFKQEHEKLLALGIAVAAFVLPFILNPVSFNSSAHFATGERGYKLNLDLLYNNPGNEVTGKELRKGRWVVAYLSLSCSHCRLSAYKMQIIKKKHPELPIYFVLYGKDEDLKPFMDESKSENIPHMVYKGEDFIKMSGPEVPSVYLLHNSMVDEHLNYATINEQNIENWLEKK